MMQLANLSNLEQLTLYLGRSKVSNLEPLANLRNLKQLMLSLSDERGNRSGVNNLEPLAKLPGLLTLSIACATKWERASFKSIPAGLFELKF